MKHAHILAVALVLAIASVAHAADAKENWDKQCAKCHGAGGKGDTKMGKKLNIRDLTEAKVQGLFTDEKCFSIIKDGVKEGGKTKMKPAENLSDDQIKALVAYVRAFKK